MLTKVMIGLHFKYLPEKLLLKNISASDSIYRPGLKYFFAIQHILFGKSSFVAKLLEIWLFLFSLILTFKIILKFTKIIFQVWFEFFNFYYILEKIMLISGKGLSSYYSYVCVLFLVYFLFQRKLTQKYFLYSTYRIINCLVKRRTTNFNL